VHEVVQGTNVKLAGQNMHAMDSGAFTGEVSPVFLLDCGCEYVLLGHSERRRIFGETSAQINEKLKAALGHGLTPVLCIGETAGERAAGQMVAVNSQQLEESLAGISADELLQVVIAYEPVWAINNKFLNPGVAEIKAATPQEAEDTHVAIRKWLVDHYGTEVADRIPIQYGGSVAPNNADELFKIADIDGGLVGGASLKADQFAEIIKAAANLS
jgi:triosephosphate isomerase